MGHAVEGKQPRAMTAEHVSRPFFVANTMAMMRGREVMAEQTHAKHVPWVCVDTVWVAVFNSKTRRRTRTAIARRSSHSGSSLSLSLSLSLFPSLRLSSSWGLANVANCCCSSSVVNCGSADRVYRVGAVFLVVINPRARQQPWRACSRCLFETSNYVPKHKHLLNRLVKFQMCLFIGTEWCGRQYRQAAIRRNGSFWTVSKGHHQERDGT